MKYFPKLFITCTLLIAATASAEITFPVTHQKDRFTGRLQQVQGYVNEANKHLTLDEKIDYLDYSGARELFTEFQNLIRIYQGGQTYQALDQYYEPSKKFEDLISHVRDLKSFAATAANSGDAEAAAKYKKLLEEETAKYQDFIANSGWFSTEKPLTGKITSSLESIQWPDLNTDRDFLLKRIAKRMGKIHAKDYDVTKVEEGIHELKRDARRLFYLDRALDLIYQDSARACPIGQEPAKEDPKPVTSYQCHVSSCLTDKLMNAQYTLDTLKMNGLSYELAGKPVPAEITNQAKAVLDDLKGSKVFLHLESQINGCQSPGAKVEIETGDEDAKEKP